uniref:ATPase subunit 8 n=1 Tax=Sinodasynus sp. TaxID=2931305 RepID=A0A8T9ZXP1_9HEMI|nr:ATPase subunit 8 [Sinodasynus sp.]
MPQMSPLWWETLFIMFIILFMMINMILFFNKPQSPKQNKMHKNNMINQFKWTW